MKNIFKKDKPENNLIPFLEDSKKNRENLELLLKTYKYKNTATFIGAGTSKPLGIDDWEPLLEKLLDCCNITFKEKNRALLENCDKWPELAEKIYNELEQNKMQSKYFSLIKEQMTHQINSTTLSLFKIILASRIHLTTNFDTSIEYTYKFYNFLSEHFENKKKEKQLEIYCIPNLENYPKSFETSYIYYLHGHRDYEIYILKESDYKTYYPSVSHSSNGVKCIENCLRTFYINYNIIFIGFSFQDKFFKDYFFYLSKEIQQEKEKNQDSFSYPATKFFSPHCYQHFLIIDADNPSWMKNKKSFFKYYEEYNIYPIIYKSGQHYFIEELFDELMNQGV